MSGCFWQRPNWPVGMFSIKGNAETGAGRAEVKTHLHDLKMFPLEQKVDAGPC